MKILQERMERLDKAITDAKTSEVVMKKNMNEKKVIMDTSKIALDNNTTSVYSDEQSALYQTVPFDEKRMTYVPYNTKESPKEVSTDY